MTATISADVQLETTECCSCGVVFALPKWMLNKRREDKGSFYCPNGHSLSYTKSRVEKLQEELEQTQRALSTAKCETMQERRLREDAEQKHARLQKRVKNGVCPCCKRTFANLARHMATKHNASNEKAQPRESSRVGCGGLMDDGVTK